MGMTMINGKMISVDRGSMVVQNNVCYVNGKIVPDEDGEYEIGGSKVTVKNTSNGERVSFGNYTFIQSNNGCSQITVGKSNNIFHNGMGDAGHMDDHDYIVSGMGCKVRKNLIVRGDVIINGTNNKVKFKERKHELEDLEIKGDLIISGIGCNVGNIVSYDGDIINSGINNTIKR